MSQADTDHDRYRALLKDADDEPKRLALIRLLIDEGARDKLAARLKLSQPEPLPEYPRFVPFATPFPAQREMMSHEGAAPRACPWPDETDLSAATDDVPIDGTDLAARPGIYEPEPPTQSSQPQAPKPSQELTEPTPQNIITILETVTPGPDTSIGSEPSRADDLADRVSKLASGRGASDNAGPVAPMASSTVASPTVRDVEIAARIEAALAELTRDHTPRDAFEYLGGGEVRLSLPAPFETPSPEAMRSVAVVRGSTHDLIARFVRLMSKRLTPPAATFPSGSIAPPSDDEEEGSIASQIQAALAKQKRDL